MQIPKFLVDNWQAIAVTLAPVATFFAGFKIRKTNERKADAEADSAEIQTLATLQSVYDIFTKQAAQQLNHLADRLERVESNYTNIRQLHDILKLAQEKDRKEIASLKIELDQARKETMIWKAKHTSLKKKFDDLEKKMNNG